MLGFGSIGEYAINESIGIGYVEDIKTPAFVVGVFPPTLPNFGIPSLSPLQIFLNAPEILAGALIDIANPPIISINFLPPTTVSILTLDIPPINFALLANNPLVSGGMSVFPPSLVLDISNDAPIVVSGGGVSDVSFASPLVYNINPPVILSGAGGIIPPSNLFINLVPPTVGPILSLIVPPIQLSLGVGIPIVGSGSTLVIPPLSPLEISFISPKLNAIGVDILVANTILVSTVPSIAEVSLTEEPDQIEYNVPIKFLIDFSPPEILLGAAVTAPPIEFVIGNNLHEIGARRYPVKIRAIAS